MATIATPAVKWLAAEWEKAIDSAARRNDAATISGIVGDLRHRKTGGYHISREDQPAWNYSVAQFREDRLGPSNAAAAVDENMRPDQMVIVTTRLLSATRRRDPRIVKYVRAFNGTTDGRTAIRVEVRANSVGYATPDHLWHLHLEIYRAYVNDMAAMRSILAVVTGAPDTSEHDIMSLDATVYTAPAGKRTVRAILQADDTRSVAAIRERAAILTAANAAAANAKAALVALQALAAGKGADIGPVLAKLGEMSATAEAGTKALADALAERDAHIATLTAQVADLATAAEEAADLREQVANLSAALRAAGDALDQRPAA